ncbi:MAG: HTTM domain-containing protein [Halolamina sp.]
MTADQPSRAGAATDDVDGAAAPTVTTGVRRRLASRVAVDARALAALRIGLGAVVLVDLLLRSRHLRTFYTDAGVLPRATLGRLFPAYRALSLHALGGDAATQVALLLVAGVAATALAVGYRTRLATAVSLALLVSLQARNPLVLNAGDVLLRRLLFWGLFLPLGRRWAVDARRRDASDRDRSGRVATVATAGLLCQVVLVYASNAAAKLSGTAWPTGRAVRLVFALEEFTVGVAPALRGHPTVLQALAFGWLGLVAVSWLLVALDGRARTALAGAFAAGHVGMALTLDLGVFPLVSLVALVPFVDAGAWDRIERRIGAAETSSAGGRPPVADDAGLGPSPEDAAETTLLARTRRVGLAAVLVGLLVWNAVAVGVVAPPGGAPDVVEERSWDMFGHPPRAESWYVANATTAEGTVTGAVAAAGPASPPPDGAGYPGARWRKYESRLRPDDDRLLAHLAGDVCRRWSGPNRTVRRVTVRRVVEPTDLGSASTRRTETLGRYDCEAGREAGERAGVGEG